MLSLLVLLASISWPAMESQMRASEMPDSADRLRSTLFMARSEAVMQHRRHRIRFLPEQQQPLIEYEPDPVHHPGVFEPVEEGWAKEPVLLAEVQIHEVRLGRPVWTKPLPRDGNPDELRAEDQELEGAEERDEEQRREEAEFLNGVLADEIEEVDENRPMIVFEVDGSSDWVTLILARVDPEEELEEEEPQT
ncbi:MAG: hypothetical protein JXQ75_07905, partial [Phycisphaerae bacterium]|nr:hypothetical protein [Phycisphaerae bacterium]